MMMPPPNKKMLGLCLLLVLILKSQGFSMEASPSRMRLERKNNVVMLLDPKDSNKNNAKQRVITPTDIASLFGDPSTYAANNDDYAEDDEEEYDYENTSKRDVKEDRTEPPAKDEIVAKVEEATKAVTAAGDDDGDDANTRALKELVALEELMLRPPAEDREVDESKGRGDDRSREDSDSDSWEVVGDMDTNYVNLDRVLDQATRDRVLATMSMSESEDAIVGASRVFKYDPSETVRGDPMKYGAYRRWKLAEEEGGGGAGAKGRPRSLRQASQRAAQSGNNKGSGLGSGPVTGAKRGQKGKKGKGSTTSADSFYDAIKKFGSGPASRGTQTGTGVAEPNGNKRPIQPKKAPTRKNRKRVITPDDINNLFADKTKSDPEEDEDDEDEDADSLGDYDSDDNDNDKNNKKTTTGGSLSSFGSTQASFPFNPMMGPNEETPKWIIDAEKEASEKKMRKRGGKKKSITDDWRFWTAVIAVAGFSSAFYNIYQQTGGFGSGERSELVI